MKEEQIRKKANMYIRDFHSAELSETDLVLFAGQLLSEAKLNEQLAINNSKVFSKRLTKAEEILRELLKDAKKFGYISQISFDLTSRIENFLKGV